MESFVATNPKPKPFKKSVNTHTTQVTKFIDDEEFDDELAGGSRIDYKQKYKELKKLYKKSKRRLCDD